MQLIRVLVTHNQRRPDKARSREARAPLWFSPEIDFGQRSDKCVIHDDVVTVTLATHMLWGWIKQTSFDSSDTCVWVIYLSGLFLLKEQWDKIWNTLPQHLVFKLTCENSASVSVILLRIFLDIFFLYKAQSCRKVWQQRWSEVHWCFCCGKFDFCVFSKYPDSQTKLFSRS